MEEAETVCAIKKEVFKRNDIKKKKRNQEGAAFI
jgi:hypothetical protein